MRETPVHRWFGDNKDRPLLRRIDGALSAAHHVLNWAHTNLEASGELGLLRAFGPHLRMAFDVGAHEGHWTRHLLRAAPQCTVHCFEPSGDALRELRSRLGGDPGVVISDLALHASAGSRLLKQYRQAGHLNSLVDYPHDLEHTWAEVTLESGDSYADRMGVDVVDLLKIDTDGSERAVLEGFRQRLGDGRIGAVQFEYGRVNILTRALLADFAELFGHRGYDLFRIRRTGLEPIVYTFDIETFFVSNFLAVHRSREDLLAAAEAHPA